MAIEYPALGSTGAWGTTINNNFRYLNNQIQQTNTNMNALRNLIGAGVPYIDYRDEYAFVKIVITPDGTSDYIVTLNFFSHTNLLADTVTAQAEYSSKNGWETKPPLWIGTHVAGVTNNTGIPIATISIFAKENVQRGDFLIATQQFSSIQEADSALLYFNKFAELGSYVVPRLGTEPYQLCFDVVNYVDWWTSINAQSVINTTTGSSTFEYTLPSIGYRSFSTREFTHNGSNQYTVTCAKVDDATAYRIYMDWFLKASNGSYDKVLVNYSVKQQDPNNGTIEFTITVDTNSLATDDVLVCEYAIEHNAPVKNNKPAEVTNA